MVCAAVMFFAAPCEKAWAYVVKVNKGTQVATVYDDYGYPVRAMTVSTGATGNTPEGWFRSSDKYIWRDMIGGTYCQYVTRVTDSFLFHSVPYWSPVGSQMVARYFNALGTPVSAGCIRTSCENAKWVYDNCASGTWFYIFYGTAANDPLGKPPVPYINYAINDRAWDPTDPNPNNPYYMYPNSVAITNTNGAGAFIGGTYRLTYSLTTRGMLNSLTDTVTWSSSNPSVAKVDSTGLATGVSYGTTTITATTVNGLYTSCTFTVGPHVESAILGDMNYLRGRTELIPVAILPAEAWLRTYTCASSDTDIAELSTGVSSLHTITGRSVGTATISLATTDGGHAASGVATIYDYTVVYKDYNGVPISTQNIGYGEEVVVPEKPVRLSSEGYDYTFVGWDKVFDRSSYTITNTAVYSSHAIAGDVLALDTSDTTGSLKDVAKEPLQEESVNAEETKPNPAAQSVAEDDEGIGLATIPSANEPTSIPSANEPASIPGAHELAGIDRYATAAEITFRAFPSSVSHAVIATGADFPDALAAAPLAGLNDAPILITGGSTLSWDTYFALYALDVKSVSIVGGTGAVSSAVESQIMAVLQSNCGELEQPRCTRFAGMSRVETAESIYAAGLAGACSSTAILTTGMNFPDGVSISPYAYATNSPIFLTSSSTNLSLSTDSYLSTADFDRVIIIGGSGVISDSLENLLSNRFGEGNVIRIGGVDRYETSLLIADWCKKEGVLGWDGLGVATGLNYPDALTGGALQGSTGSTMLLMDDTECGVRALSAIATNANEIQEVRWLGGSDVIVPSLRGKILEALSW